MKHQTLLSEIDRDIDHNVIATVQRLLDGRRRSIGGAAPKAQYIAELAFCQRLDATVKNHMNLVAARALQSGIDVQAVVVHGAGKKRTETRT